VSTSAYVITSNLLIVVLDVQVWIKGLRNLNESLQQFTDSLDPEDPVLGSARLIFERLPPVLLILAQSCIYNSEIDDMEKVVS